MQDLGGTKKDQGKKISWNCGETTDDLKEISEAVLKYSRQKIEEIEPYTTAKWQAIETEHQLWAAESQALQGDSFLEPTTLHLGANKPAQQNPHVPFPCFPGCMWWIGPLPDWFS